MFSRRQLFRLATTLGAGSFFSAPRVGAAQTVSTLDVRSADLLDRQSLGDGGRDIYKSIGVRPLINCRGTLTIIGGSIELPEVRAAKSAANQQHAHLDEVMEAVGKRLAELTGAEWGMVSAGCAAAMSHATAACVAGGNPDLHVRLPNLTGFAKDEVIIPTHSRNVYDAAIRAVGVKIIEVDTPEALQLAIGPKTAMIYIFAGPRNAAGPMSTEAICAIAKPHGIPVLVDAAAEILTIPNVHLQRGATLVAYSGGKYIRGPQSAGLLLGRKDLVKAAWVHSAPHHGYARAMKVGREEMIGMLVAVESWVKRDHAEEWNEWVARCDYIADRVSKIPGVTAMVQREPGASLSNRSPRVTLQWDSQKVGITSPDVTDLLDKGEPRILLGGGGGAPGANAQGDSRISITSAMMSPGDEKIVAQRIVQILSAKHTLKPADAPTSPVADLSGRWQVEIQYTAGRGTHMLHLQQNGHRLEGTHQGEFLARDIAGTISGDTVTLASNVTERHGDALTYRFSGKVSGPSTGLRAGETLSGSLDMGEYLAATWTARPVPPKFAQQFKANEGGRSGSARTLPLLFALLISVVLPADVAGQVQSLAPAELTRFTPLNPYDRFPDGRPKVPDALVNTIREMGIDVEEAWGLLRQKGFTNQYEANWKVLLPDKKLVGRAFTVQFMPTRPDVADAAQKVADEKGLGRLRNQTAIDMLQSGDVAVVDLFGKVEGGTFVGDKLAYYVQKTTGTGLVVDGALFYLSRIQKTGMPAYYRGTHPGSLTNVMLTGINVPVRIGDAIVMPGDIVLGDRDGILFIPPQLVEEVIESAKTQRLRDEWVKAKFDTGKYKSGEIYGRPSDPKLQKELEDFMKQRSVKKED